MKLIHSIPSLRRWRAEMRKRQRRVVFVPTMGALHEGHLALVAHARRLAGPRGAVGVSVFVNPTQFDRPSDLAAYPRTLAADAALCRRAGADLLFAPSAKSMYPPDFSTWVEETRLALPLCGGRRPGHFRGVCTVVLKLFHLVQPDLALFGWKDAQQALVIQRMARDLDLPVRIVTAPTVRERDGLAMSSRNRRLSSAERARAPALYAALCFTRLAFREGVTRAARLKNATRRRLAAVPGLRLDYLELVDGKNLRPVTRASRGDLLAVAAFLGATRLIDNVRL